MKNVCLAIFVFFLAGFLPEATLGVPNNWLGGASGYWTNAANWSFGTVPTNDDETVISSNASVTVILDQSATIGSLTLTNSNASAWSTLLFSNGATLLTASNVFVSGRGQITHAANSDTNTLTTNRVNIICSNIVVRTGGAIYADALGYDGGAIQNPGKGPGAGVYGGSRGGGGGYGGVGGRGESGTALGGSVYGSATQPDDPGSGGAGSLTNYGTGGKGGGVIRIQASQGFTNDGEVSAIGGKSVAGSRFNTGGAGAGGSIHITCGTFGGSGVLDVTGGNASSSYGGGGGGGRIAVDFNSSTFSGQFKARGGSGVNAGAIGSVCLTDPTPLPSSLVDNGAYLLLRSGSWNIDSLTLSNYYLRLATGTVVAVTNDVKVLAGGRIHLLEQCALSCSNILVSGSGFYGASRLDMGTNTSMAFSNSVTCTNLTVTNALVYVYPASALNISGDMFVMGSAAVYMYCHPTITNPPILPGKLTPVNLTVGAEAQISAYGLGYAGGDASGDQANGYGPGGGICAGDCGGGGGYGGVGGVGRGATGGSMYGSTNNPTDPGSGGGRFLGVAGRAGGGVIRIQALGTVTVNGTIAADGSGPSNTEGAGSGGSVNIACGILSGAGTISANGGAGSVSFSGGGGGGRIAVVYTNAASFTGQITARGNSGRGGAMGDIGTLYMTDVSAISHPLLSGGAYCILSNCTWNLDNLVLSNYYLRLPTGTVVRVTNDIQILAGARIHLLEQCTLSGSNILVSGSGLYGASRLDMGTNTALSFSNKVACASLTVTNGAVYVYPASVLTVVGNVSMAGSAAMYLYPASVLNISNDLSALDTATVYMYCNSMSTNPPVLPSTLRPRNLTLGAGAMLYADAVGYAGGTVEHTNGYGPGGGPARNGGGGYGGVGGKGRDSSAGGGTYGSSNNPTDPGSGGSYYNSDGMRAGAGGGVIRIENVSTARVDGTISARGGSGYHGGSGSGGSIYISCDNLAGSGTNTVAGGTTSGAGVGGAGGGGRIALLYLFNNFYGTNIVSGGSGYSGVLGSNGTVYASIPPGYLEFEVQGDPIRHGESTPYAYGVCGVASGGVMVVSVNTPADETNGVRYGCIGWSGTGSVPIDDYSNSVSFTMTENSMLIWRWTSEYHLATSSEAQGSLDEDKSAWYTNGLEVAVACSANDGWHFLQWVGDVPFADRTNNPIAVTMDQPRSVRAVYAADTGGMCIWIGGTGQWTNAAGWLGSILPGDLDTVVIPNGAVTLDQPWAIGAMILSNATLTTTGWLSRLTVQSNVLVENMGVLRHADNSTETAPTSRLDLICGSLTVDTGGQINVDGLGYAGGPAGGGNGYGPGGGTASGNRAGGGGYGGVGGRSDTGIAGGNPYGSGIEPNELGSGGGRSTGAGTSSAGGGLVRITCAGMILLNGSITANGVDGEWTGGSGSGGGIYISCAALAGAGTLQALGGNANTTYSGGGGGGRIAVHAIDGSGFDGTLNARGGNGANQGDIGTVYVLNPTVLCQVFTNGGANLTIGSRAWNTENLALSNYYLRLATGTVVTVTNDVWIVEGSRIHLLEQASLACSNMEVSGTGFYGTARLDFGTNVYVVFSNTVLCAGDFTATDADIYLYPESRLAVAGDMSLMSTSMVYLYCHPTSTNPPLTPETLRMRNLTIASAAKINADAAGYLGGQTGDGYGPGAGRRTSRGGGGGHGGRGGDSDGSGSGDSGGVTNGLAKDPQAGSGGAAGSSAGGNGGGLIRIQADATVTLDGTLTANGGDSGYTQGAGSGGGIYVFCHSIAGNGIMRANGGAGHISYGGAGGGGRIAVHCMHRSYMGQCLVNAGSPSYSGGPTATVGSVYWWMPGTIFTIY